MSKRRPSPSPVERFWTRFAVTDGCWIWRGAVNREGYGHLKVAGRKVPAHRFSFRVHHGREPTGLVLHSCDVPNCVNPSHLREGTVQDNSDDMVARGRSTRGLRNPNARLSNADVVAIRESTMTYTETARAFGIHPSYVWSLKKRRHRAEVP